MDQEDKINELLRNGLLLYKELMAKKQKALALKVLRLTSEVADLALTLGRQANKIRPNYKPVCALGHRLSDEEIKNNYFCDTCDKRWYEGKEQYE